MHVTHSLHDGSVRALSPRSDDLPGWGVGKGLFVPGQRANRDKQLNRWSCDTTIRALFEGRETRAERCSLHE
jgi:hypothetical protein